MKTRVRRVYDGRWVAECRTTWFGDWRVIWVEEGGYPSQGNASHLYQDKSYKLATGAQHMCVRWEAQYRLFAGEDWSGA